MPPDISSAGAGATDHRSSETERREELAKVLAECWPRMRTSAMGKVETIAEFARTDDTHDADDSIHLRKDARRAAHQLSGSVGAFGFRDASFIAMRIEKVLEPGDSIDHEQLSSLTEQLSLALNTPPAEGR